MGMIGLMIGLVQWIFNLLQLLVLVGIALSWVDGIRLQGISWLYSPPFNFIRDVTFRFLRPFRKLVDMILRAAGIRPLPIDFFSPLLAFFTLGLIEQLVVRILLLIGGRIG